MKHSAHSWWKNYVQLNAAREKYEYEISTGSLFVIIILWYRILGAHSDEYS